MIIWGNVIGKMAAAKDVEIAVLGGSGLYNIEDLEVLEDVKIDTPFGDPSDTIRIGLLRCSWCAKYYVFTS